MDDESELEQYVQYDNFDLVFGDFDDHSLHHVEVEHTELEYHEETHMLINTHFPQLVEKLADREEWTAQDYGGVSALVFAALVVLILARALLRWLTKHHSASILIHNFGCQGNPVMSLKDSLNKVKNDFHTRSGQQRFDWVELNVLAHSLLHHVSSDFTQFEAIMGDCDAFFPSTDALEALSDRVDAIVKSLDAFHRSESSSHSHLAHTNHKSIFQPMHIEDKIAQHIQRKQAAEVRLSFDLLKDALREGRVQSKQRQLQLTLNRLWKAINAKDEYGALECLEVLGEEQRHRPEYSEAMSMLSTLRAEEDQQVREEEQWTFERNKADMIEAFQTFSINGTPREAEEGGGSSKKLLSIGQNNSTCTSGKIPRFPVPIAESGSVWNTSDIGIGDTDYTAASPIEAVEANAPPVPAVAASPLSVQPSAPPSLALCEPLLAGQAENTGTAAGSRDRAGGVRFERSHSDDLRPSSSSSCSSPLRNLIHSNSSPSCLSTGPSSPMAPPGTGMLINSQWAMEALKMKRESQLAAERRLQELRTRREERREAARRGARWILDERDREARKARLFLDGLEEQKKLRLVEEGDVFRRTEQGLLKELEIAQEQQRRQDERVFRAVSLVAAIVYMLAQSRFDVAGGGVYSLYRWMLRTLRISCEFLSCDTSSAVTATARVVSTTTTAFKSATVATVHTHAQLALPAPPASDALNRSAVLALRSYQSSYRGLSQYVATAMLEPVLSLAATQYTIGATLLPYMSSRQRQQEPAAAGGWAEFFAAGKCAVHLLARSFPAVALSRLFRFIGLKELSGWAAFLLSVLCFSDVLLQMAVGPLLPLLVADIAHKVLYELAIGGSLRWRLRGSDVRWLALYVIYPTLVVVLLAFIGRY